MFGPCTNVDGPGARVTTTLLAGLHADAAAAARARDRGGAAGTEDLDLHDERCRAARPSRVARDEPRLVGSDGGGEPVGDGGGRRRRDRVEPLGQERRDDTREHVARPGRGERGRARVADDRFAGGRLHDRVGALQQHDGAEALGRRSHASSRCSSTQAESRSSRRASSPACGVSTVGWRRAVGSSPKSASASTTTGNSRRSSRRATSACASGAAPEARPERDRVRPRLPRPGSAPRRRPSRSPA